MSRTNVYRAIPNDEFLAIINANAPSDVNPFATIADVIAGSTYITVVANYSTLPAANTVTGQFYWVENSQGTAWLPGSLGGTYYPKGLYYSNGVDWIVTDAPYQASQAEVNAGVNNDKFVTPLTLENATKWTTKADAIHNHTASQITDFDTEVSNNSSVTANTAKVSSLYEQAGIVTAVSFTGNPKKATVTMPDSFVDANYSISVTGTTDGRDWTVENKTVNSFVINSNANLAPTGNVEWIAVKHGDNI